MVQLLSCEVHLSTYVGWFIFIWFGSADVARNCPGDIRPVLASYERKDVAKEFIDRSIEYQK